MDLSVGSCVRRQLCSTCVTLTAVSRQSQFLTLLHRFIFPCAATERADQGWQPHKGPQRVLPGLTRALTGHRGRLTRNECSLNDVVTPPGGAHCVGIITHRSSNPICGMRRVNHYSVVRLCNVMNSPLPLARLRQYIVNIKCA